MPRFNFAWDLRGDGDLILRVGAGLFHNRPQGNAQYYVASQPPNMYNTTINWWDVPGGLTISSLPTVDPWSRLGSVGLTTIDTRSVHLPRTWSWSLAVGKRLPWEQALEVAYVGNRADQLFNQTPFNHIPPGTMTGPYGNAALDNPLDRAALDSSVVAALRPYPAYSLSTLNQFEAYSHYYALQATLSRMAGVSSSGSASSTSSTRRSPT